MSKMRRLLSMLIAILMVLTLPITTGIARTIAEGTETDTPSQGTPLEMEDLDPATLHVHKLGEEDETEEPGDFNPDDLEIQEDLNKTVRVSIFLDGKSAIDQGYDTQSIAKNSSAVSYVEKLLRQQNELQSRIEAAVGHPLTVKWHLTILVNAISVEIPYKDIFVIERLEGVRKVEVEPVFEPPKPVEGDQPNTANTSENMVGAQNAWYQLGYTGAGSRVAIIDTGLDVNHQSMDPDAFMYAINAVGKADLLMTREELNQIPASMLKSGTRNYVNAKIPYGYNYVDHSTRIDHQDSGTNHGSHVAGIAAANRFLKSGSSYVDAAETVGAVGMAPDAQIFVMKVFSSSGASPSDYFAALEDAIVLGCDAANLSLGSASPGWTWTDSEYQTKMNSLVNNETNGHLVLAISAGNSYAADDYVPSKHLYAEDVNFHTGGTPGSYINSLGVAAADNTLTVGTPLVFNGSQQVFYRESTENSNGTAYTNPEITTIAGTYDYVYIDAIGTADDYAAVNSALSLSGKIVIVNRGTIAFSDKGNNAVSFSPKAVIVANTDNDAILMDLSDFTGTFPMVMILLRDAEAIKAASTPHTASGINYYTGTVEVTTQEVEMVKDREDAEVSSFSSWGVPGSLIMKPEITAPGGTIYSLNGTSAASSDSNTGTDQYVSYSGTSMAAPHITGLTAVLMQYLKEKTPANTNLTNTYNLRAIAQSLLMSTATPMINDNAFVSILQQGAGLVEVSNAITSKSVIMMNQAGLTSDTGANADGKVKVELGDDPARKGEYEYSFTLYNLSDEVLTFELETYFFTQAISNGYLMHTTTLLPFGGVTYEWNGAAVVAESHDVDRDGDTDDDDAQAILDYLTGEREEDEDFLLEVADMDGDDLITTVDAQLLLNWEPGEGVADGYTVAAHDKAQVTVHIKLTDAQKAVFEDRENGGYIEGFTYVSCVTSTDEGVSYDHEHSIPILGYYGSWTDPSMFDTNSYTESLYGNEQLNYSGSSAESTNYMRVIQNGVRTKFS
ncbi:MAG: S8 family serine peptidase, partial [Clostridia bacterium]|nr:S8 family serine peptidase [Clostridia bacterium]